MDKIVLAYHHFDKVQIGFRFCSIVHKFSCSGFFGTVPCKFGDNLEESLLFVAHMPQKSMDDRQYRGI